jgi:hypothetical protein
MNSRNRVRRQKRKEDGERLASIIVMRKVVKIWTTE